MKETYGVVNISQTAEFKEKYKIASIAKYAVDHPFKSKIVRAKCIEGMRSFYEENGISHIMQIPEVAMKAEKSRRKTFKEKYGVSSYMSTDDFKSKSKSSFLKNHGISGISEYSKMMSTEDKILLKNRAHETLIKKYGSTNPHDIPGVSEKIKNTTLQHYGVEHHSQTELSKSKFTKNINKLWANAKDIKCPHCDMISRNWSNMKRYHFDKCKKMLLRKVDTI